MSNPFISTAASRYDENDDHKEDASKAGHDHDGGHAHEDGEHDHDDHGHDDGEHTIQKSMDWYLSPDHLIGHVQDQTFFEIPGPSVQKVDGEEKTVYFKEAMPIYLPNPLGYTNEEPLIQFSENVTHEDGTVEVVKEHEFLGNVTFQPTKFIVLELFAALIVAAIFITLGRKMKSGEPVKGRFWNMLEAGCTYIRDDVARPSIGSKDGDRFLPFLWTIFFFVLAMNLIGMVPGLGAATGSISITASLALVVFAVVLIVGMKKLGGVGFWKAQAPHIDIDGAMSPLKYLLVPMIWGIEVFGLFLKHLVLAVRLFANMFAGHLVLAVFVAFIAVVWNSMLAWGVVPAVMGASLGINLLELLVAFIQAYVFTMLSALFIGAAIHPH
jgi:F-type H+-transporting ATPase subunit a